MKSVRHSIGINSAKEKVWETLWNDRTFRDWAGLIDPDTYMTGELKEGREVNFIGNKTDGVRYGVTGKVERMIPAEYILFTRVADIIVTDDGSIKKRDDQWTGGREEYKLEVGDSEVTLTITQDVPEELVSYFNDALPKVLERIKFLAENS